MVVRLVLLMGVLLTVIAAALLRHSMTERNNAEDGIGYLTLGCERQN